MFYNGRKKINSFFDRWLGILLVNCDVPFDTIIIIIISSIIISTVKKKTSTRDG